MAFVQVVLTDDHVRLLREGLGNTLVDPEEDLGRASEVSYLEMFLDTVAEHPGHFPVTGSLAGAIKHRTRLLKGPAQPKSRRNKRKARQERRIGAAKQRRAEARDYAQRFNTAQEAVQRDIEIMHEIQLENDRRRGELILKDTFTNDEVRELLDLIGMPQAADYIATAREANSALLETAEKQ